MSSIVECPNCNGENAVGVTRVVGYFSRVNDWNPSKIGELRDRHRGTYGVVRGEVVKPLSLNYGQDGVYLIGKEHCPLCSSEEKYIQKALKDSGLEGMVAVYVKKITDVNGDIFPKNLALAAKMNVSLNNLPAVVMVREGRIAYREHTVYKEGEFAGVVKPDELTGKLLEVFALSYSHESS